MDCHEIRISRRQSRKDAECQVKNPPCSRSGAAPLQWYPTRPLYGYLAIFSSLVLDLISSSICLVFVTILISNDSSSECSFRTLVHTVDVFSLRLLGTFSQGGDVYITWPIAHIVAIALQVIFQPLHHLLLVGNACHPFKLPTRATLGPCACHEGAQ